MEQINQFSRRAFLATAGAVAAPLVMPRRVFAERRLPAGKADKEFLDTLERRTFDWFWETANPENGLVPDRWPRESPSSIAAVGFGLAGYGVGVERGYVSREQAVERVRKTLRFFGDAPQGEEPLAAGNRGFFYHFLNMKTGERQWECELSSIDTGLLMCGVLFCREYFDRDERGEREIRERADALYRRVEWTWMQPRKPLVCMSWRPERGFGDHDYKGYDEAMFLYVLALGSPTHPIDPAAWPAFTSTYQWGDFYGQEHVNFGPLFGHQYSHAFIDFRRLQDATMRDKGLDYFENSRRATQSQRAYAIDNPQRWRDYSDEIWGLTACDGPAEAKLPYDGEERQFHSYWARGAALGYINDDGTLAPTAAGGSIPFAPEICIPALRAMQQRYGDHLFAKYGFLDAFNPSFTYKDVKLTHGEVIDGVGWFDSDYLGIDQGPILLMTENFRSELIWDVMKKSPYVRRGLERAGFTGGWLDKRP
ncbi:MAG: glucoamylase family protein [Pirellulales bacterium]